MRSVRKLAATVGFATMLVAGSLLTAGTAATAAAPTTITVGNFSGYEYLPTCSNTAPYPCSQVALTLEFRIYTSKTYNHPIHIGWSISGGTATPGVDFTGSATGTVTIAANTVNAPVDIQLVNDGFGESNETFNVHLTSADVPADLTSVGTETILDGSRVPGDCSLGKTAPNEESMTCTSRPAGQQWYLDVLCNYPLGDPELTGNIVTGNGTSEGTCNIGTTNLYGTSFFTL